MRSDRFFLRTGALVLALTAFAGVTAAAQKSRAPRMDEEFGPIVRAYLGYLRNQQEVVDDRISRREVDRAYYVRNSNRIRALRQMAIRIARENDNDYLPELEAVAGDEFTLLFDEPPKPDALQIGETFLFQFRYLGPVASGRDKFYVFARLDPYEQAEQRKKAKSQPPNVPTETHGAAANEPPTSRPRRVTSP